jgi:hypothetical protein
MRFSKYCVNNTKSHKENEFLSHFLVCALSLNIKDIQINGIETNEKFSTTL